MKVTVWGGAGFLGSHVCDALSEEGYEVTIADINQSQWKKEGQHMLKANLLDIEAVFESVKGADYVFNFAGIADIPEANSAPLRTSEINIMGNLHLLEACLKEKVKRYIFASSLYVYSNSGGFYRCSKQACEGYIEEYNRQFGLTYTVLRYGSLYGTRTNEQNAIYRFIKQALTEKTISYYGSPNALREYIHAEDAARICCKILDKKFKNKHLTITGHQSMRVGDLMLMIMEIIGEKLELEFNTRTDKDHYEVTPYSYSPKLGFKYSPEIHTDFGQGILQMLDTISNELNSCKK